MRERGSATGGGLSGTGPKPKMLYPLVADLAGEPFPVMASCRLLGLSTTVFHAWRRNPVSQRDWNGAHRIHVAIDAHAYGQEFRHRLIAGELIHAKGFEVGQKRVQRLCSRQGINSSIIKRRGSGKKGRACCS